jgi:hypothetical protein
MSLATIAAERNALAALPGREQLVRREQWDSDYDYTNDRTVDRPANRVFVHISVTNPDSFATNAAHIRHIEAIGESRFPATGGSYNRATTPDATGFELQPIHRRGAHTVNVKEISTCVTDGCPSKGRTVTAPNRDFNLNFNARAYVYAANVDDPVSDAVIHEIAQQIAADMLAGFVEFDAPIHGHRCVAWKDCPGGRMFARLDEVAALVKHYVRDGFADEPPTEEIEMSVTVTKFGTTGRRMIGTIVYPISDGTYRTLLEGGVPLKQLSNDAIRALELILNGAYIEDDAKEDEQFAALSADHVKLSEQIARLALTLTPEQMQEIKDHMTEIVGGLPASKVDLDITVGGQPLPVPE